MNSKILAFTTIRQGDPANLIERTRSEVVVDTLSQLHDHEIQCVAVYKDCAPEYLAKLRSLGTTLVQQNAQGMGNTRREALREVMTRSDTGTFLFWLEPEKPDMPRYAKELCVRMVNTGAKLGLFNRTAESMSSYPAEQSHYYQFCRAVASQLAGFDIDYAFGPIILHPDAVEAFLAYDGRYNDLWDSILVPRIPFVQHGEVVTLEVNFQNDARMTQIESGNPEIILKRVDQFNNVIPSLIKEWSVRG